MPNALIPWTLDFILTNLKGINTSSDDINFTPGYIFWYILDEIFKNTETNNMEQKIHIQTL